MERHMLGDKMYMGKHLICSTAKHPRQNSGLVAPLKPNFGEERLSNNFHFSLDNYLSRTKGFEHFHGDAFSGNGGEGTGFPSVENRVAINLKFKSKKEISDIKAKLENELMSVRNLMKRIECYSGAHVGSLKRVHSVVDSVDGPEIRRLEPLLMPEGKSRVGKGASQRNLDVTVQMNKSKANAKKTCKVIESKFGMDNSSSKVYKSCSSLLNRLMKSKVGWVFNKPVDVKSLGLHDYFTVIEHPMDLGTVKSRLHAKLYRTSEEFAEDVRLTFHNALRYNLEGHDVHTFAKQLLKMFEDNWVNIESDCLRQSSTVADSEAHIPTQGPTAHMAMKVDRSEIVTNTAHLEAKSTSVIASGTGHGPKPKVKDLHKREMTLAEKEKLSSELQNLPPEKIEGVLEIIKKRNPSLCQSNDEIEVDIDIVDTETLWELDRFVIYYKKTMSKMRRDDKLVQPDLHEKNQADCEIEEAKENKADEKSNLSSPSNEREKEGLANASASDGSSSSGSSSSDSGSSSSGSDTDSPSP